MFKQKTKVNVYVTLHSNSRLDTIKFDNLGYSFLKQHRAYIRPDHFKSNDVVRPDKITKVHPMLVWYEAFCMEVEEYQGQS
eukprot:2385779-Ditylum_brightwellii.AAC.2